MQNWHAMEQQVRDRVTQARTAARIRALTQTFAPTTRRRDSVGITILRLANWVVARAMQLASGGLTRARQRPSGDDTLRLGNQRTHTTMCQEISQSLIRPSMGSGLSGRLIECYGRPYLTFHLEA